MRRRAIRLGLILFILLGLAAGGLTWYLNAVFLPGPARQWLATWLAEQTGRRIQMGQLTFGLWEGVSIHDLVIFEDQRYGTEPFLELERLSVSVLYLPLLKERRLILPSVTIIRPRARLVRDRADTWNIQGLRLFQRSTGAQAAKRPLTVTLLRLAIENGSLLVDDQLEEPGFNAALTRVTGRALWQMPSSLRIKATAQWQTTPVTPLLLQGRWDFSRRSGDLSLTARQLALETVRPYLPAMTSHDLRELTGRATVTLKAKGGPTQGQLTATVATQGLRWQWREIQGLGDVTVTGHGSFRLGGTWQWTMPQAAIQCHGVTVQAPAPWPALTALTGTLQWNPVGLTTEGLTAQVNEAPVTIRGSWQAATVDLEAISEAPLEQLWRAAAPYRSGWLSAASLEGTGQLRVTLRGALPSHPAATLTVTEGRLTHPTLGTIESLSGRWLLEPNLLTVAGARGQWRGHPLELSGTLVNFADPEINCAVRWGPMQTEASLAVAGSRISLTQATTTYRQNRAETTGELVAGETVEGTLYSEMTVNVADALTFVPTTSAIHAWQPTGTVKGRLYVKGPLRDLPACEVGFKGRASTFTLRRIRFDNVQGEYRQHQGEASIPTLAALCYGGQLQASGTMRLDHPERPFTCQGSLANLELSRLAQETPWRSYRLAGLLSGTWQLSGSARPVRPDGSNGARALPGSLAGQARLQVTNGQLFEIPVLRGLADLLGAPALRRVTFHEAAGTFTVQQETLTTSDLTFYSQLATLTAIGSVGFNGALDAHVITSIDPTAFEHSPEFARAAGRFLHKAGYLIGEIKVSGTLANPKYEIMPVSLNRILKEQVFERLRDVFEGIFR